MTLFPLHPAQRSSQGEESTEVSNQMMAATNDQQQRKRFNLHLPIHFRISHRGETSRWASGMTCDVGSDGVTLRCRKALPVGAHVEMVIEWPARQNESPIELLATGLVARSTATTAAINLTAHRFRIESSSESPMSAIA